MVSISLYECNFCYQRMGKIQQSLELYPLPDRGQKSFNDLEKDGKVFLIAVDIQIHHRYHAGGGYF